MSQKRAHNKKRLRKPHNPHQRLLRQAGGLVAGFGVAYITGRDNCDIVDLFKDQPFPATLSQVRALTDVAHTWSMYIAALGIDDQGRKYIKAEQLFLPDRRKQADMADALNRHHQQFVKTSMNPNHLVAAAWIGSPEGRDISEAQADRIFTALNAWA